MPRVIAFMQTTLNGYFADEKGDVSWAHSADPEYQAFGAENAKRDAALLFGRKTYEMMAGFWTSPQGKQLNPTVAEQMSSLPKIVFSRTLTEVSWSNTRLVKTDPASEIRTLKAGSGKDMAILGSGSLVAQLGAAGLIDELQVVVCPLAFGKGRTLFEGIDSRVDWRLTKTRAFPKGNVLLCYEPQR